MVRPGVILPQQPQSLSDLVVWQTPSHPPIFGAIVPRRPLLVHSASGPNTMAGSLLNRSPTCLACLRRLAQPFGVVNGSSSAGTAQVSLVQIRAKSNRLRPHDQGVVVRLLQDIPKYGRKGRQDGTKQDCWHVVVAINGAR